MVTPRASRSPIERHPATVALLVLIAIMWVAEGGLTVGMGTVSINRALALGAQYTPDIVQNGQWWRLLAAMFIHWSWLHIIFNAWSLWILGSIVEPFEESYRFLIIYIVAGLFGGLVTLVFMPANTLSAGASGAIFGLLGAVVVISIMLRGPMTRGLFGWAMLILVINLVIDVSTPGIAIWDHIGGFVGGMLATLAVGLPEREPTFWNTFGVGGLVVLTLLLLTQVPAVLP